MSKKKFSEDVYEVGGKIRSARIEAGMTQEQLAERAGISGNAVSRYEMGESEMGISMLFRIADATGTSPDELMPERYVAGSEAQQIVSLLMRMEKTDREAVTHMIRRLAKA